MGPLCWRGRQRPPATSSCSNSQARRVPMMGKKAWAELNDSNLSLTLISLEDVAVRTVLYSTVGYRVAEPPPLQPLDGFAKSPITGPLLMHADAHAFGAQATCHGFIDLTPAQSRRRAPPIRSALLARDRPYSGVSRRLLGRNMSNLGRGKYRLNYEGKYIFFLSMGRSVWGTEIHIVWQHRRCK